MSTVTAFTLFGLERTADTVILNKCELAEVKVVQEPSFRWCSIKCLPDPFQTSAVIDSFGCQRLGQSDIQCNKFSIYTIRTLQVRTI